jgi:hypothetical protein
MRSVWEEPKYFTIIGSGEEVHVLTLEVLRTSWVQGFSCVERKGYKSSEAPKPKVDPGR